MELHRAGHMMSPSGTHDNPTPLQRPSWPHVIELGT